MKKQLLPILFLFLSAVCSAQVCNPDMSFSNAGPGVYPVSIATPDCSDTLGIKTIVSITDTTVQVTNPITLNVTIYYDSSRIVSVSGMPTNLSFGTDVDAVTSSFAPYGAWVNGGTPPNVTAAIGCVYVHGNPTAWQAAQAGGDTGVYVLEVEYDARISETDPDVSAFGIPPGTWLSEVDPSLGGGTITIQVPMDTDPITNLQVPVISGNASAFINTSESYSATAGAASYTWTVDGGTIQTGQGTDMISVIWDGGVAEGTVTVEVGHTDGCTKSQTFDVDVAGVSVYEVGQLNAQIFPNPSSDFFNIELYTSEPTDLTLMDLSGKLIMSRKYVGSIYQLDVSALEAGVYILKLETDDNRAISRVIVE
jgi:hypothetical protein